MSHAPEVYFSRDKHPKCMQRKCSDFGNFYRAGLPKAARRQEQNGSLFSPTATRCRGQCFFWKNPNVSEKTGGKYKGVGKTTGNYKTSPV